MRLFDFGILEVIGHRVFLRHFGWYEVWFGYAFLPI